MSHSYKMYSVGNTVNNCVISLCDTGFPDSSVGKESICNEGDPSSIPGLGRSAGEGVGCPLQYSWASPVAQLVKKSTCNVGDLGSIPGLGRSPGEGNSYPLQYSGLENSKDCIVHGVANNHTQLSDFHFNWRIITILCWFLIYINMNLP